MCSPAADVGLKLPDGQIYKGVSKSFDAGHQFSSPKRDWSDRTNYLERECRHRLDFRAQLFHGRQNLIVRKPLDKMKNCSKSSSWSNKSFR